MSSAPGLVYGLKIIEILSREHERGFNQLREDLALSSASLNRYLKILAERDFVVKNERRLYSLGARFSSPDGGPELRADGSPRPRVLRGSPESPESFGPVPPSFGLPEVALPILAALGDGIGATAVYMQFVQGLMRCAAKVPHSDGLAMQEPGEVRSDYPLHPWGYLYLASREPGERELLCANAVLLGTHLAYRPDPARLRDFILRAEEEGFSDDLGTILPNARRLAAPVYSAGVLIGAVGVGMPGTELRPDARDAMIQLMKEKAALLGTAFGPAVLPDGKHPALGGAK